MIKRLEIDLSNCSGYIDGEELKVIKKVLRKERLLSDEFLYSVFNGDWAEQVETSGNYRAPGTKTIFAFTARELVWDRDQREDPNSIKTHAKQYFNPAMVVYIRRCFNRDSLPLFDFEYRFNNPEKAVEAVAAIAFLK